MEVEREEEEKKRISNTRKTAFCNKKISRDIAISKSNAIPGGNAFFAAAKKRCHAFKFVIIKNAAIPEGEQLCAQSRFRTRDQNAKAVVVREHAISTSPHFHIFFVTSCSMFPLIVLANFYVNIYVKHMSRKKRILSFA